MDVLCSTTTTGKRKRRTPRGGGQQQQQQQHEGKKKQQGARDAAGRGKKGHAYADVDVWALLRTRRPPLALTLANKSTPRAVANSQARAERSVFSQTMHAVESWDGSTPLGHVTRPPSVLWRREETGPLSDLGRDPAWPMAPPAAGAMDAGRAQTMRERNDDSASRGPWYAPPQIDRVLERGARGYGSDHAVPPDTPGNGRDLLTGAQRRVLFQQNGSVRGLPHRVRSVVRQLRREDLARQHPHGWFAVSEFMTKLEDQSGERLVHVSMRRQEEEETPVIRTRRVAPQPPGVQSTGDTADQKLAVALAYALDAGGRFFLCVRWRDLPRPPAPHGGAAAAIQPWWADARVGVRGNHGPEVFLYSCPCSVGPC